MPTEPRKPAPHTEDRLRPAVGLANGLALGLGIWCAAASVWLVVHEAARTGHPAETAIHAAPSEPAPSA